MKTINVNPEEIQKISMKAYPEILYVDPDTGEMEDENSEKRTAFKQGLVKGLAMDRPGDPLPYRVKDIKCPVCGEKLTWDESVQRWKCLDGCHKMWQFTLCPNGLNSQEWGCFEMPSEEWQKKFREGKL